MTSRVVFHIVLSQPVSQFVYSLYPVGTLLVSASGNALAQGKELAKDVPRVICSTDRKERRCLSGHPDQLTGNNGNMSRDSSCIFEEANNVCLPSSSTQYDE